MKKKIFLVEAELGDDIPTYTFVVQENTLKKAEKYARSILKQDYPENWQYNKDNYLIYEATADQVVERLTL